MTQNKTAITVSGLEKSFKSVQVLKGVDFAVKKGQIFALLGSNGAGKTTTVKILATLIKPDAGSVQVEGFDVARQSERVRERISLTGQYAAVDEALTGRENLHIIGALRHLSGKKEKADRLINQFALNGAADRKVSTYSGGMRRKLDIAMSLLGDPSVIFLDEPTTGLDPQSRLSMWKTIEELSKAGTTIFLTTQYLEEAERLADYIAILHGGSIAAEGTVKELKKRLPGGIVCFTFKDAEEMEKAANALHKYSPRTESQTRTVSVAVEDGTKLLMEILNQLKESGVVATCFAQKAPTLEDVFLTLIEKEESGND